MLTSDTPRVELESIKDVQSRLADPEATWHNVVLQGVDLASVDSQLAQRQLSGCVFLGCSLGPAVAQAATDCVVFPRMQDLAFDPYRSALYRADDLLNGFRPADPKASYERTMDWQTFVSYMDANSLKPKSPVSVETTLVRRIHDNSMSDALEELLHPAGDGLPSGRRGVVGIMGGHDLPRQEKSTEKDLPGEPIGKEDWEGRSNDSAYTKIALLSWKLTRSKFLLVTGGGPGAMEAANLGCYFATRSVPELRTAIRTLEVAFPGLKKGESGEWLKPAIEILQSYPLTEADRHACASVGIPTWFYGHEPPNVFATHIAKYFENSIREEGLLAIATHGVIYAEGNGGTVQEIFQDACQNYYKTYGNPAPMVLFGVDYWDPPAMPVYAADKRKKVFPLLNKLAGEKGFTHRLLVTDSIRQTVSFLSDFRP